MASSSTEAARLKRGVATAWAATANRDMESRKEREAATPKGEGKKGLEVKGESKRILQSAKMADD